MKHPKGVRGSLSFIISVPAEKLSGSTVQDALGTLSCSLQLLIHDSSTMTLRQGQRPTAALGPMAGDMRLGLNYQMLQLFPSPHFKEIIGTHPKTKQLASGT